MLDTPNLDRRAERYKATVAEIIQAAWELARAGGLAGLSLRELASKVGMRAPSLYSYFDSKNAIYDAMYAQGAREFLERETRLPFTGDPLEDLKTITHFFFDFSTEDPVRYQLLFQRSIPGFQPSPESFAISIKGLEVLRERLTAMGFNEPDMLDLVTAVGTGLTSQQISNDPGGDRWARLVDESVDMLINHLNRMKRRSER